MTVLLALCVGLLPGRAMAVAMDSIPWVLVNGTGAAPVYENTGIVALTQGQMTIANAMWDPCTINLTESFNITWSVFLGSNNYNCGGDGMAFVLQSLGTSKVGLDNGEHGYSNGSIANSVAVILDTYQNPGAPYSDPNYESMGFEVNGSDTDAACAGTNAITGPCRPPILTGGAVASNGTWLTAQFIWTPMGANATLEAIVNGNSETWNIPNYAQYFSAPTAAYFGMTASSGGQTNYQQAGVEAGSTVNNGTPVNSLGCAVAPTPNGNPVVAPTYNSCAYTPIPTLTPPPPTDTPSNTPTPYPTVCGAVPAFVQSSVVGSGCVGSGNPTSFTFTVPPDPGEILLIQVESTGPSVPSATWNGAAMTALAGSPAAFGSVDIYTFYTVAPVTGSHMVNFGAISGCSVNVVESVYDNVNPAGPIGATNTSTGNASTYADTITTTGGYSIVADLFAYTGGSVAFTGLTGSQLFVDTASGCCDEVYGSYLSTSAPGLQTLDYTQPNGASNWWGQSIELKAVTTCTTPTDTPSFTPSQTPSETLTYSVTDTLTCTKSPTPSLTYTYSPGPSPTPSATPSRTPSPTPSATPSVSFTSTATNTFTDTDTPSNTRTPSPSVTESNTFTDTSTPTASASPTPTGTQSNTFTDTATPSASASPTPSATQSNTFTDTATPSNTETPTPSATQSDTFSPSPTPSGTPTPSPSFTNTSTFSDTPTQTATASATPSFTNSPTFSVTPTITQTSTVSPTPIPVAVQITVAAYNAAGEEVDTIYQGGTEYLPTNVSLSGDLIVDGTQGVQVNLNTPLSGSGGVLSWNGINNNGQYVGSGIYYIRTTYVNTFGMATSYIDSVQVLANPGSQDQITIFNSAGEVVWQGPLPTGVLPSLASQPLSLTSSALALALNASGSLQAPLGIKVGSNIEYWNGLNMQGQLVSPGTYSVVLSDALPGSSMDVQTKQFQAVASSVGLPSAAAVIVPNPWRGDVSLALLYTVTPGYFGEAVLYDLAGEIVARSEDPQAMGKLTFNRQKLAGGIYLLDFRQMDGPQITTHKTYKLAVVE